MAGAVPKSEGKGDDLAAVVKDFITIAKDLIDGMKQNQQTMKELTELIIRMNCKEKEEEDIKKKKTKQQKTEGETARTSYGFKPRKYHFPTYDGSTEPTVWLYRAEEFFEFYGTAEEDMVRVASLHLEGAAIFWLRSRRASGRLDTWEGFKEQLQARFGLAEVEDPFVRLCHLRQTSTVAEYYSRFRALLDRVLQLDEESYVNLFVAGLRDDIRTEVAMFEPRALSKAVKLALRYEEKFNRHKEPTWQGSSMQMDAKPKPAPWPMKRLAAAEMAQQRGNCDEKFFPGHRCKAKTLYLALEDEGDTEEFHGTTEQLEQETQLQAFGPCGSW